MVQNENNKTTKDITDWLTELSKTEIVEKSIINLGDGKLLIEDQPYTLVEEFRDGFDLAAFSERYQPFFKKYDYIVGDWGFNQLRLRGFYQMNRRRVPRDQSIHMLDDYIREYCNFGAAFFVLGKDAAVKSYEEERHKMQRFNTKRQTNRLTKPQPNIQTRSKNKFKPTNKQKKQPHSSKFIIK